MAREHRFVFICDFIDRYPFFAGVSARSAALRLAEIAAAFQTQSVDAASAVFDSQSGFAESRYASS